MFKNKKSLGQNFLIDKNISNKIVNLIENANKKNIIEIGPGKGALTQFILNKNPKKIILIEKDNFLFNELKNKYKKNNKIKIYNEDALNFNYECIKKPKSIVANLPYNISIKLIINFLKRISDYKEIVVMIQKEVAQKMNYNNSKKRNRLNILTEMTSNFKVEFNVSNNVFFPKPLIKSSVIKIKPRSKLEFNFTDLENFTRMLFRNKRKKIHNVIPKNNLISLKKNNNSSFNPDILQSRAEDLTIEEIVYLFKKFSQT